MWPNMPYGIHNNGIRIWTELHGAFFTKSLNNQLNQIWPIPFFLARSSIIAVGSDPMDRRQIIGVRQSLSSHIAFRSRMIGSAYFGPIESAMYLRACDVVLSGHHELQRIKTTTFHTTAHIPANGFNNVLQNSSSFQFKWQEMVMKKSALELALWQHGYVTYLLRRYVVHMRCGDVIIYTISMFIRYDAILWGKKASRKVLFN